MNGVGGNAQWDQRPWERLGVQNQVRGQLSPKWEITPFSAVNERMCRPLVLDVPEGCVRDVIAEVEDAERRWNGQQTVHPIE
eukprot:15408921-Alexandrium_andersonii.AAC.1